MRVILDTNILVSALLTPHGVAGRITQLWRKRLFNLLTAEEQMNELRRTLQKDRINKLIVPHLSGVLLNNLRRKCEFVDSSPCPNRSPDPADNYLLAMAEFGRADYLVTGDKGHLLVLVRHTGTRIINAKSFADMLS